MNYCLWSIYVRFKSIIQIYKCTAIIDLSCWNRHQWSRDINSKSISLSLLFMDFIFSFLEMSLWRSIGRVLFTNQYVTTFLRNKERYMYRYFDITFKLNISWLARSLVVVYITGKRFNLTILWMYTNSSHIMSTKTLV